MFPRRDLPNCRVADRPIRLWHDDARPAAPAAQHIRAVAAKKGFYLSKVSFVAVALPYDAGPGSTYGIWRALKRVASMKLRISRSASDGNSRTLTPVKRAPAGA